MGEKVIPDVPLDMVGELSTIRLEVNAWLEAAGPRADDEIVALCRAASEQLGRATQRAATVRRPKRKRTGGPQVRAPGSGVQHDYVGEFVQRLGTRPGQALTRPMAGVRNIMSQAGN